MSTWTTSKLGDVCRLINGRAYKKHEMLTEGPYPILRVGNFFTNRNWFYSDLELHEDKYCDNGDLLYAWSASFGPRIWEGQKVIYHYHIWKIEIDETKVDKNYMFHLLDWDTEQIKLAQGTGTTMVHVTKGSMENRLLPFPPIPEQQRIVTILDQAFADIEKARANAEKNLKNARELFDSYLNQVFSQRGEGWVERLMPDICEITSSLVDPREQKYLAYPHVGAGNIASKTGALLNVKSAEEEGLVSGKFVFDSSMVLYSKIRPYLMKVCRPDFEGLCSADIYPLKPNAEIINRDFLFYMLLTDVFTSYAIAGSARAGMPKVNRTHLFDFAVWLPSVDEQKQFVDQLNVSAEQTRKLEAIYEQKLASLDELKKSILHQAFSGELTKAEGHAA
ncbi:restriction endonuclease subunit S [Porticoccaceae bacterium]|nr:restriction endonuclease subunit S [Porticoccaceae bacterium]